MSTNSSCWSRYLDILLGLVLLLSLVCLLYAGYSQSRIWIIDFITASLAVVLTYWCWFLYIKASGMDFPDSEEMTGDVLAILSCIYGFILLPVLFFYRSLELAANQAIPIRSQGSYSKRKPPPKYSDGNFLFLFGFMFLLIILFLFLCLPLFLFLFLVM